MDYESISLPIGLNRISWKRRSMSYREDRALAALPIGLNRISWKQSLDLFSQAQLVRPYRLG